MSNNKTKKKTSLAIEQQAPPITEPEPEGSTCSTWGTGTGNRTMTLHIRKVYYQNLGWKIGDLLFVEPDFKNKEIRIRKVDKSKL